MSVRKAVVGVVYKKDGGDLKFLVLHRIWGWEGWEFPKGGIERTDPTEESALLREIKEETGLTNVRIITKLPFEISYKYPIKYAHKYKHSETRQTVFLVRSFSENVLLPAGTGGAKEHDAFEWLPYKDARSRLTHENHRKAMDIAIEQMSDANE